MDELFAACKAMLILEPCASVLGRFLRGDFVRYVRRRPERFWVVTPPAAATYHVGLR